MATYPAPSAPTFNPFANTAQMQGFGYLPQQNKPISMGEISERGILLLSEGGYGQPFDYNRLVINRYGTRYMFLDNVIPTLSSTDVSNSSTMRYIYGQEIVDTFQIRAVITAAGTHQTVTFSIYSPGFGNNPVFAVNDNLAINGFNQYTVTATGTDADGFQTVTVQDNSAEMIQVFGTVGAYYTNDISAGADVQSFGSFGDENCQVVSPLNVMLPGPEREIKLFKYRKQWSYDAGELQQSLRTGNYDLFGVDVAGPDGTTMTTQVLITEAERQMMIRNISDMDKARLFGQFNQNIGNKGMGTSLMDQIAVENRLAYNPNRNLYTQLRDQIITRFGSVATSSMDLIIALGSNAYAKFQSDADAAGVIERRTEPNWSFDDASRVNYLGQWYGGFVLNWGLRAHVVQMPAFDTVGRKIGNNKRQGANNGFIFDPGDLQNLNLTNLSFESQGQRKIASIVKRNATTGEVEGIVNQYKKEGRDMDGRAINGEVREFGSKIERLYFAEQGIGLKDPMGALSIAPLS